VAKARAVSADVPGKMPGTAGETPALPGNPEPPSEPNAMKSRFPLGRFLLIWAIFFGLYLLLVLQWQFDELVAGACSAALVAGLLVLIRDRSEERFVFRWSWLWLLARRLPG
jgi:hypothetical protein